MNIFILNPDLNTSATMLFYIDPIRARKQIVESTQMIAIGFEVLDLGPLYKKDGTPYKTTCHRNHPCTKWTYQSKDNLIWHFQYTKRLCTIYKMINNKEHACNISLEKTGKSLSWNVFTTTPDVCPPFIGSEKYTKGPFIISEDMITYQKYLAYLYNKQLIQDNK